jgi:hypothetical protein
MVKNPQQVAFQAASLGSFARDLFSTNQVATVLGSTSKGVFLQAERSRWLLFVSFETFPGPLNLNLPGGAASLDGVSAGMEAFIRDGRLVFSTLGVALDTSGASLWQPPPLRPPQAPGQRREQLLAFGVAALGGKKGLGLSSLLAPLLGLGEAPQPGGDLALEEISAIRGWVARRKPAAACKAICGVLGRGPGLTPWGDDFVIGLLLCINRFEHVFWPGEELQALNRCLVSCAYQKTTTLSANLIECASLGQAEARLIAALDCIVCGCPTPDQALENLLGWGDSSGASVLVGMVAALTALDLDGR